MIGGHIAFDFNDGNGYITPDLIAGGRLQLY